MNTHVLEVFMIIASCTQNVEQEGLSLDAFFMLSLQDPVAVQAPPEPVDLVASNEVKRQHPPKKVAPPYRQRYKNSNKQLRRERRIFQPRPRH